MLGEDELAEVEGDALLALRKAGLDAYEPVSPVELCRRLTGLVPRYAQQRAEGQLTGDQITLRMRATPSRVPGLLGHELGHWWYREHGRSADPQIEHLCDAFSLAVLAPRPVFLEAVHSVGHRVHLLAEAFGVSQSFALLRLGEVTRRPVALAFPERGLVTRGAAFVWGLDPVAEARATDWRIAHPLRITDDTRRLALMAR